MQLDILFNASCHAERSSKSEILEIFLDHRSTRGMARSRGGIEGRSGHPVHPGISRVL